jgi:glycosyltransferase involved in cell wall biosynthesis
MTNGLFTILITSYECAGMGKTYLEQSMNAILAQTYRNIQVVISDHSKDDIIQDYIKSIKSDDIEIIYTKFTEYYGSPCHNWNNGLTFATGEYIQYLALDDMLADTKSVENAIKEININPTINWFVTAHNVNFSNCVFTPRWNNNILQNNTISGPSAVIIRSTIKHIKLDPEFIWYLDLDWYYRLYKEGGKPGIISHVHWINRTHPAQLTFTVCDEERRNSETAKLFKKYGNPLPNSD